MLLPLAAQRPLLCSRPLLVVSCWARQMLGAADWNRRREPRATDHHPFIPRLDSSSYCPVLSFLHLHIHPFFPLLRFHPHPSHSFFFLSYSFKGSTATTCQIRCRHHSRRRWASANKTNKRPTEKPLHPIITPLPPALDSLAPGWKICASAAYLIIDTIHLKLCLSFSSSFSSFFFFFVSYASCCRCWNIVDSIKRQGVNCERSSHGFDLRDLFPRTTKKRLINAKRHT